MVTVGEISTWHSVIVGTISIFLNSLLLFTICSRSLKVVGAYKYMMLATATLDLLFSMVDMCASPTFASVDLLSSLLIVMGGFRFIPAKLGRIMLIGFMFLLCQTIVTPPCLFSFRYLQICRSHFLSMYYNRLQFLLIIPLVISSSCCAMISFAAWPTKSDRKLFDGIASHINVDWNSPYLVASFHKYATSYDRAQSIVLMMATIYLVVVMVVGLGWMVFCTKAIMDAAKHATDRKTRNLQVQLCRTLIAQSTVPFFFIHVPFYICILMPLMDLDTGIISDFLPFLFAWSPATNPLIVLYFVRDYRTFLLRKVMRFKYESSPTSSVFYVSKKKQTIC